MTNVQTRPPLSSGVQLQRTFKDCILCCVANISGRTYEEVYELSKRLRRDHTISPDFPDIDMDLALDLLACYGYRTIEHSSNYFNPERVYMASAPSLNQEAALQLIAVKTHQTIYGMGAKVIDPMNGVKGKRFYSSNKEEIEKNGNAFALKAWGNLIEVIDPWKDHHNV